MKLLVFGITGSIGKSLLDLKCEHEIVGISFNKNYQLAQEIVKTNNIKYYWSPAYPQHSNVKDLDELIHKSQPDMIVNAVTGMDGVIFSFKALEAKKDLCLANKESLVIAGKWLNQLAKQNNLHIYPIDSEHTALYDLLMNRDMNDIKQLIITCSGGSCYHKTKDELKATTYEKAIKHPNWSMGEKISMDSCTLMNKCFEIVEAYHLFNNKNIIAIHHPQSVVHSMIEFKDNTIFANMSTPDMKSSIDLAIHKFQKPHNSQIKPLSFNTLNLTFTEIDKNKWKPIQWAYDIINDENNNLGLIVNFANEIAIERFKNNEITLDEFYNVIYDYIIQAPKAKKIHNKEECLEAVKALQNKDFSKILKIF